MRKPQTPITILLADDDEEDLQMTIEALRENRLGNDLRVTRDGEELIQRVHRRSELGFAFAHRRDVEQDFRALGEIVRFLKSLERVVVVALLQVSGAGLEMSARQLVGAALSVRDSVPEQQRQTGELQHVAPRHIAHRAMVTITGELGTRRPLL